MSSGQQSSPILGESSRQIPVIAARACQFCRGRKIKCDGVRPTCGSCLNHGRPCIYALDTPKERPSRALINAARREKRSLEELIVTLKQSRAEERNRILDSVSIIQGNVKLPREFLSRIDALNTVRREPKLSTHNASGKEIDDINATSSSDEDLDVTAFVSMDDSGKVGIFGPSSAMHVGSPTSLADSNDHRPIAESDRYLLIANAALQRQSEHDLRRLPTIGGIDSELAMHLLDLHWNRQHHTFLLTYRPAFMRDLLHGGPYCSEFLLNAVFACSSKFSERIELRSDPSLPETAGQRFFDRCDELLSKSSLLESSSIPTIVGLLMLGSTFNARHKTSKGWLFTGYALMMVYDLGLHLDFKGFAGNAEEIEIRRRVFWGAFICDKLQCLYLGRPARIQLRDSHVSRDFMDTLEEMDVYSPYDDLKLPPTPTTALPVSSRLYSISTFQQLCSLSKIMTIIMNRFYVAGVTAASARSQVDSVEERLRSWYKLLPEHLKFEPWLQASQTGIAAPNVIVLLTTYNAVTVLLHRPFISSGHLRSSDTPANSWERCITAARNITSLALAYKSAYSLRRANYLLSYAIYVACTIHARNPAVIESTRRGDVSSPLLVCLRCLDDLAVPNSGVSVQAKIIRRLMDANGIPVLTGNIPHLKSELSMWNCADKYKAAAPEARSTYSIDTLDFEQQMYPEPVLSPATMVQASDFTSIQPFTHDLDLLFGFMNEPLQESTQGWDGLDASFTGNEIS